MPTKKTGHPVKKTKKQIAMQRQLTVLGVVVVIFLIIFGAGAIWGKSRASAVKPEKIAEALKGAGQLAAVEYSYTAMPHYSDQNEFYGWSDASSVGTFTISYNGAIKFYSDTSNLTKEKVKIEGKKVTVTIPQVTVGSHEIDESSVSVFDTDDKDFRAISLTDFSGFCADRKEADVNTAAERGVITDAQTKITDLVKLVVGQMGKFDSVEVAFE